MWEEAMHRAGGVGADAAGIHFAAEILSIGFARRGKPMTEGRYLGFGSLPEVRSVKKVPPRVTIRQLMAAIRRLPPDKPVVADVWYLTQKEHWLGWLSEYNTGGAYGRKPRMNRDAEFAYNHIVEPKMLLWIISAAKVPPKLVRAAQRAIKEAKSMQRKSAMVRKLVPWSILARTLWPERVDAAPVPRQR